MSGLQRFITYIYKYENDEKLENAGFAKIEVRGNICRVEVHVRNINIAQKEVTVYLFARDDDFMQGIPVGSLKILRGSGDIRYAFELKELLGFGLEMKDVEGIFIPFEENNYLASQWKEGKMKRNLFHVLEKKEVSQNIPEASGEQTVKKENTDVQDVSEEIVRPAEPDIPEKDEAVKMRDTEEEKSRPDHPGAAGMRNPDKPPIQATELPQEEFFEEAGWERVFQKIRLKLNICFPFEGKEIECVRMQLNDLKELPQKYWYIGNNSFLLHGFFNYRHILFGEMKEGEKARYFIGVPGVFQNQERIMAAMFGFPEFRTAKNTEYKTGNFGYWYRII